MDRWIYATVVCVIDYPSLNLKVGSAKLLVKEALGNDMRPDWNSGRLQFTVDVLFIKKHHKLNYIVRQLGHSAEPPGNEKQF